MTDKYPFPQQDSKPQSQHTYSLDRATTRTGYN